MTGSVFTFLADITADPRFIRPYNDYFAAPHKNSGFHYAEIEQMGMLKSPVDDPPWNATLYETGDTKPMIAAMKKDIEELQRFPYMYTALEPYTDRVFLYPIINPSIAYTGGYTTRNKLNPTYAVSWDGFGTDYAALVTAATKDHLRVLLCNLSDKPITGRARIWRLEPGEYEMTFDSRKETRAIVRGDEIELTLAPKVEHVLELKQMSKSPPLYDRPDLALSPREITMKQGKVTGIVHNIGSAAVDDVVVALLDTGGKELARKHLGRLEAPLDLVPKSIAFDFGNVAGACVVVDPDNSIPEIFEGNNRVTAGRAGSSARR
jgi:hypothetical protein